MTTVSTVQALITSMYGTRTRTRTAYKLLPAMLAVKSLFQDLSLPSLDFTDNAINHYPITFPQKK